VRDRLDLGDYGAPSHALGMTTACPLLVIPNVVRDRLDLGDCGAPSHALGMTMGLAAGAFDAAVAGFEERDDFVAVIAL
jgi:hypothetical protein